MAMGAEVLRIFEGGDYEQQIARAVALLRHGAVVVEVNPEDTPLTRRAEYALRGGAGEVLPELVRVAYG